MHVVYLISNVQFLNSLPEAYVVSPLVVNCQNVDKEDQIKNW